MRHTLHGEVAIVTGASSGIGAAAAQELARRGACVVLAARRIEQLHKLEQTITAAGGHALAVQTDVCDATQVANLTLRAVEVFGRVDVLVLNAGMRLGTPLEVTAPEDIKHMLDVNLVSAILLTRSALPGMLQRRHGAIITVSSVAGLIAAGRDPLYSATKFGLRGYSLALRRRLAGTGISVSLVSPSYIQTGMNLTGLQPNNRRSLPGPEIVAARIADLVTHPRREVVVPPIYTWVVWLEKLCPWVLDLAARRMRR